MENECLFAAKFAENRQVSTAKFYAANECNNLFTHTALANTAMAATGIPVCKVIFILFPRPHSG
jgi:hypothetical protein